MNQPPKEVLDYLKTQRVCVFAVEMLDGSPHGATVHFAHTEDPFKFFFLTDRKYRKSEPLFGREMSRATVVIGFDEKKEVHKTLQMDGEARLITDGELEKFKQIYCDRFPKRKEIIEDDPEAVLFVFAPTWWRFTDYSRPEGKFILTSS